MGAAAMLVSASAFVTLAEIAESLFVSRATIISDLDQILGLIEKGDLELASRANKGLLVEGKESTKRYFLMRLFQGDLSPGGQAALNHVSVQAWDRTRLQKIVSEQEHLHQSFLTDASFQDILLYLGIMIDRNTKGELLEPQPRQSGEKFRMAQDILRYVTQYCTVLTMEGAFNVENLEMVQAVVSGGIERSGHFADHRQAPLPPHIPAASANWDLPIRFCVPPAEKRPVIPAPCRGGNPKKLGLSIRAKHSIIEVS